MPVFNLGLQHMALERALMEPKFEELFKNAGSMRAAREVVKSIEEEAARHAAMEAWAKSVGEPIGLLKECFSWLHYCDRDVLVLPPASQAEISQLNLGGKKSYDICTDCHGRGLDVVTHGKAVQTGAAAKRLLDSVHLHLGRQNV